MRQGSSAIEMVVNGRFVTSVPPGTASQGFRTAFTLHAQRTWLFRTALKVKISGLKSNLGSDARQSIGALVAGHGKRLSGGPSAIEMVVIGRFVTSAPLDTTSQGFRTAFTLHPKSAHISMGAVPQ
jgi:hypothetical protein